MLYYELNSKRVMGALALNLFMISNNRLQLDLSSQSLYIIANVPYIIEVCLS